MFKHMLIAADGSELASAAGEKALDLAKQLGAKTTILTAPSFGYSWMHSALKAYNKAAAQLGPGV